MGHVSLSSAMSCARMASFEMRKGAIPVSAEKIPQNVGVMINALNRERRTVKRAVIEANVASCVEMSAEETESVTEDSDA